MNLFVDASISANSRTRVLALHIIEKIGEPFATVKIDGSTVRALNAKSLEVRTEQCARNDFSDAYFDYAKQFAAADKIVIAAPFYDLSFPAVLKEYIENITITGITFKYSDAGIPIGLCSGSVLYYVTTAGGTIFTPEFSFGYVKTLAEQMYGIKKCVLIKAENLDIIGNNAEEIMRESFREAEKAVKN